MGAAKIPKNRVPVKLDHFIRMEANLCSREEKMRELFGIDLHTATAREINNADATMCRWRKHPLYDEVWKDELAQQDYGDYSTARRVLRDGMRQTDDRWLAMNSAIQVIANGNKRIFRDEQNTVNVKIEGMPDLGSPDDE